MQINNIYSIKNYNGNTINNTKPINVNNIDELEKRLTKDEHLNEHLKADLLMKLVIDYEKNGDLIYPILNKLKKYFKDNLNVDIDISYTENKKKFNNDGSYHLVINNYSCLSSLQKLLFHDVKMKTGIELDTSIYNCNKWLRLPNQTSLADKTAKYAHKVINGKLIDFYLSYTKGTENISEHPYIQNLKVPLKVLPINQPIRSIQPKKKTSNVKYDKNELNKYITENNKYLVEKLQLIDTDEYDEYNRWIKIGMLIKTLNIENGNHIFNELSKKSTKFEYNICYGKYETFKPSNLTIGTLNYLAKLGNPEKYEALSKIQAYEAIFGVDKFQPIIFDKPYLIENEHDTDILNLVDDFIKNKKSLSIKSPYGTGKTRLLEKIMNDYNPKRVLFISFRKSLTYDIHSNFKNLGFESYLDGNIQANKLIIQLESLTKLVDIFTDTDVPTYDWIIMDEIESILNHFHSDTFKGASRITFEFLSEIIRNSKKVIALDGDLKTA